MYPGGLKLVLIAAHRGKTGTVIEKAVSSMLTKSKLRERMMTRLKVYRDASIPMRQQPQAYALS